MSTASDPRLERPADVVTSPERRRRFEAAGSWDGSTLSGRVAEHAARHGARVAVVDLGGARQATYAQLDADANRLANYLSGAGIRPGDVVGMQLPNWYETVVIALGVFRAGAVLNPMLPIYRGRELRHMLAIGGVTVLFTPGVYRGFDHVALVEDVRRDVALVRHHVAVADPGDDAGAFARWLRAFPNEPPDVALDAAAVSELMFTSGTEAQPKAIMHTEQTANFSMRTAWSSLGMTDADVIWMPSPIGHSTGFNYGVRMALYHGLALVLQDHWSPAGAAALIERFRCSYTLAATTFVSDLVEHAGATGGDLSSMRLLGSGGAPVPPELVTAAEGLGATVLRLYGSTEVLVATWNRPGTSADLRVATDGPALDDVEVEVRSAAGEAVVGEPGEIVVRGPNVSVGFFADPVRTAAGYDADGWLWSGDLGVLDAAGHLTIVGRKKEIIIRGGLNIAPREIEELLLQHPGVREVAVVGLPDERLGETTCACVVARDGAALELSHLVGFLQERGLATYKLPERVEVLDALPKTPSGKIQKFQIVRRLTG